MKYLLVLGALLARVACADDVSCEARTAAELRTVLVVAIALDEASRQTTSATLRARLADFDRRHALPCAAAAAELLRTGPDLALERALLDLASSRAHAAGSSYRGLSRPLARFLAVQPDELQNILAGMPAAHRCRIVETIESGWPDLPPELATPGQRARGDGLVANLKRVYCRATVPKPGTAAPGERRRAGRNFNV
jgi:hypothetical protein